MDVLKQKILDLSGTLESMGDLPDEEKETALFLIQNLNSVVDKVSPQETKFPENPAETTLQNSSVIDLQKLLAIKKVGAKPDPSNVVANSSLLASSSMSDPVDISSTTSLGKAQGKDTITNTPPVRKRGRPRKTPIVNTEKVPDTIIRPKTLSAEKSNSAEVSPLKPTHTKCQDEAIITGQPVLISSSGRPKRISRLPAKLADSAPIEICNPKKTLKSIKNIPRANMLGEPKMIKTYDKKAKLKPVLSHAVVKNRKYSEATNDDTSQESENGLEPGELDFENCTDDSETMEQRVLCCYICIGPHNHFKGESPKELSEHIIEKHAKITADARFLECPECHRLFKISEGNNEDYADRFTQHSMRRVMHHMVEEHHIEYPEFAKVVKCPDCDFHGIDKKDLVVHQVREHRLKCKLCHEIVHKAYIQKHIQTVHADEVEIMCTTGNVEMLKAVDNRGLQDKTQDSVNDEVLKDLDHGITDTISECESKLHNTESDSSDSKKRTDSVGVMQVAYGNGDDLAHTEKEKPSSKKIEAGEIKYKQITEHKIQFTMKESETSEHGGKDGGPEPSESASSVIVIKSEVTTQSDPKKTKTVVPFKNAEWDKYFEHDSSVSWTTWEEDDKEDGEKKARPEELPEHGYCLLCIDKDHYYKPDSMKELAAHLEEVHLASGGEEYYLKCPACCKSFKLSNQFKLGQVNRDTRACMARVMMHMIRNHNYELPSFISVEKCEECDFLAPNRREIQNHMRSSHGHGRVTCELCGKSVHKHYIKLHMSNAHGQDVDGQEEDTKPPVSDLHCLLCVNLPPFLHIINLAQHIRENHLVTDQEADYISCPECQQRFKLNKRFDVTRLNRTVMTVMEYTLRHMTRTHAYQYPEFSHALKHQCKDCDFVCHNKFDLKLHRNQSHMVGRVKCEICDQYFTKTYLEDHIWAKHKDKSLKAMSMVRQTCHKCNKDFCSKATLKAHIRLMHGDVRLYLCDRCAFWSRYKNKHQDHLFRAHGENAEMKPIYQCGEQGCGYQTLMKDKLQAHMMTHGNDNVECDVCGLTFNNLAKLEGHKKRVHSENKMVFPCPFCQERCCRRHVLGRHVQRHHSQEVTFDPKVVKGVPTSSLSPMPEGHVAPPVKRRKPGVRSGPAIMKKAKLEFEDQGYHENALHPFSTSALLAGTEAMLVYQDDTVVPPVGNTETIEAHQGTVVQIDPNIASIIQRHQVDETVKVMGQRLVTRHLAVGGEEQVLAMEPPQQVVYEEVIGGTNTVATSSNDMSLLAQALLAHSDNQNYVIIQEDTGLPQVGNTEEVENMEVVQTNHSEVGQVIPEVNSIIQAENSNYQTVYLTNSDQPEVLECYLKCQDT